MISSVDADLDDSSSHECGPLNGPIGPLVLILVGNLEGKNPCVYDNLEQNIMGWSFQWQIDK